MSGDPKARRSIAQNRKARHLYNVLAELECGIVLAGTEVKSLRAGQCSLAEAYGRIKGGELWLVGATIAEYRHGNVHNHAPRRDRKLLAHKREIERWSRSVKERGITLVPLELYFSGSRVKALIGLCRGKKLHDKRQVQRERDDRRAMDRAAAAARRG